MAKAIRFYEIGGPEVLRLETVEVGEPGPGQARVRHTGIAVNFIDIYFRTGRYPTPLPSHLGSDAVGVVEAIGPGVTDIAVGDRVGYLIGPQGAYSDVRVMPAAVLIRLPDGISDSTAATIMMKGMTAQYLFHQVYPLKGGETILYHAAAGGVGLIACQWARAMGVTMIGTVSSDEKAAVAQANGCTHTIVTTRENIVERVREITGGHGADVVFDPVGGDAFDESLRSMARGGRLLVVGFASGRIPSAPANRVLMSESEIIGVLYGGKRTPEVARANFAKMIGWYLEGKLKPHISMRFTFDQVPAAMNALLDRSATGKVLVTRA